MFKWSSSFHLVAKPSVLPTWMSLEGLPIHFFNKGVLFSIATATGKLFKIDEATANFIRPSVFRVCIEVDLLSLSSSYLDWYRSVFGLLVGGCL